MPKPKPPPENATRKRTISLPAKVSEAGDRVLAPDKAGREDFASLMTTALVEYLERHHPGLIEATAAELRAAYPEPDPRALKAAEPKASARAAKKPAGADAGAPKAGAAGVPPLDELAAREAARWKKKERRRARGAGAGASASG